MRYLSQRDLQWCDKKLGQSSLTIGRYGCTTTCISMLSDYFGEYTMPSAIAANVHYYTPDGLILWTNLKFHNFEFVKRQNIRSDVNIKAAIADPNQAVILNVNNGAHWVVAVRPTLFGDSYIVVDPWTGTKCDVIKVYKNIVGAAYFKHSIYV